MCIRLYCAVTIRSAVAITLLCFPFHFVYLFHIVCVRTDPYLFYIFMCARTWKLCVAYQFHRFFFSLSLSFCIQKDNTFLVLLSLFLFISLLPNDFERFQHPHRFRTRFIFTDYLAVQRTWERGEKYVLSPKHTQLSKSLWKCNI